MNKPTVGQTLYSLNVGDAARGCDQVLKPTKVTKVGRKYFACVREGYHYGQEYHLDTWRQKTEYSVSSILYESEQAWLDEKEAREICKSIKEAFEYGYNRLSLDLGALREIARIIKGEKSDRTTNKTSEIGG